MNVLSVFDGISAGRLALKKANIDVEVYYRSEIDKYANQVAMHHFPNDVQLGDVTKWREWDIDWSSIDLFIGGSPCQGFSFAGKQGGTKAILDGNEILVKSREEYISLKEKGADFLSQSHLFWEYVLILDHIKKHNPNVKFLLENVKMKKELLQMISDALGVSDVVINSSLVSAQNRHRHYWANWTVTQPKDKGILLRDILEYDFDEKYNLSNNAVKRFKPCKKTPTGQIGTTAREGKIGQRDRVYDADGKMITLTATIYKQPPQYAISGAFKGEGVKITGGAIRGRYNEDGSISQKLECNDREKTNALTTVQKDNIVVYSPCERKQKTMIPVCESDEKYLNTYNGVHYRKLTPTECARLQTFPDGWCESVVSKSQAYKAYGNSWTLDVIAHIFFCLKT